MRRWGAVLMMAMVGVLAGCAGSGESAVTLTVEADKMAYLAPGLTADMGKPVKLVLKNSDTLEHDLTIDKIPVKAAGGHAGGHGGNSADLHLHAAAGKTESLLFTPTEAGAYRFYCTVAGHQQSGMVGTLTVR